MTVTNCKESNDAAKIIVSLTDNFLTKTDFYAR